MNQTASLPPANHDCPLGINGGQVTCAPDILNKAARALQALYDDGLPLLHLPAASDDYTDIDTVVNNVCAQSNRLILVGIGGSSLGAHALSTLKPVGHDMRFDVMENPDPSSVSLMLDNCDAEHTSWLFVSKSGGTLETVSQILLVLSWLEARIGKDGIAERCTVITEPKASSLTTLAEHYGMPTYAHDPELGGRWTCIGNVGLIPAGAMGVDVRDIRAGAEAMLQHALQADIADNQPLQGAAFNVSHSDAGRPIHVIMPYADRLAAVASWCRQLISESLGKDGKGVTPLAALGTVDQHSMLQLMLDGPDDKYFTLVTADHAGKGLTVDAGLAKLAGLDYLADVSIGNVMEAFQEGTVGSIKGSGRPIRTIHLPQVDAYHVGALLMFFMIETIYIAAMTDVNAFDQPAVEDSKNRAKAILGA